MGIVLNQSDFTNIQSETDFAEGTGKQFPRDEALIQGIAGGERPTFVEVPDLKIPAQRST